MTANEQLLQQQSRREAAENQLRQAQKDGSHWPIERAAHDSNNILGVISGSLDLIRRHIAKGE
jgi:hypothetical protein